MLLCLSSVCVGQEVITSGERIELSSKNRKQIRKEIQKWEKNWKIAEWGDAFPLSIPDQNEFDSYTVIPYIKVYPDTLTREIKYERMTEKIAIFTQNNIFFWYTQKQEGYSQLAICDHSKYFINFLNSIGADKQLFIAYFIDGTQHALPSYQVDNLGMMLLYHENGQDIFVDTSLNKYNSPQKVVEAYYGNIDKYIDAYQEIYRKESNQKKPAKGYKGTRDSYSERETELIEATDNDEKSE